MTCLIDLDDIIACEYGPINGQIAYESVDKLKGMFPWAIEGFINRMG